LDRLTATAVATLALAAAACAGGGGDTSAAPRASSQLPPRLRAIRPPPRLDRVRVAVVPVSVRGSLAQCLRATSFRGGRVIVVERFGSFTRSVTVYRARNPQLFACDATGVPLEGGRWCGFSAGILRGGRLLDPRLDVLCRDRRRRHVAVAWINAIPGARWVALDQGSFTELYPTAAGMPVRVATARHVSYGTSSAMFFVTQYAADGRTLARARLTARVAG